MGFLRGKTVTFTDQRVQLMTEILRCIRFIKMCAWENCFTEKLLSKSSMYLFIYLFTYLLKIHSPKYPPTLSLTQVHLQFNLLTPNDF